MEKVTLISPSFIGPCSIPKIRSNLPFIMLSSILDMSEHESKHKYLRKVYLQLNMLKPMNLLQRYIKFTTLSCFSSCC